MSKFHAWIFLGILSLIQAVLIYFNVDGQVSAVILPLITYFFGIATKAGYDQLKAKAENS